MLAALALAAALVAPEGWQRQQFTCARPARGCYVRSCCAEGLAIWSRKGASGVTEFRAEGEVDAPPERVFAIVTDFEHGAQFMPHIVASRVLSRSEAEAINWAEASFPLTRDRDWVVRFRFSKDPLRATWEPAPGPPPAAHVVRVTINSGAWTAAPLDGGRRTLLTYEVAADPGGWIPASFAARAEPGIIGELFSAIRQRSLTAPAASVEHR